MPILHYKIAAKGNYKLYFVFPCPSCGHSHLVDNSDPRPKTDHACPCGGFIFTPEDILETILHCLDQLAPQFKRISEA